MALPVVIPNTFANANASIPLSQLDNNFSTVAVAINGMANGAEALSNVNITGGSIANASLSNVSISSGNVTINVANVTTLDATNIEVTNIKAKDGTASATIADSTGVMTIGSSVLTTADINGGTIDATAIGGSTPAAGAFTTLSATNGLLATGEVSGPRTSTAQFGQPSAGTSRIIAWGPDNATAGIFDIAVLSANAGVGSVQIASFSSTGLAVTGAVSSQMSSQTNPVRVGQNSDSVTFGQISFNGVYTTAGMQGIFGGGGSTALFINAPTGNTITSRINNVTVTDVSSTGLAVTGNISGSAPLSDLYVTSTTGTNRANIRFQNTGGDYLFGAEDSAGGSFGATAYDGAVFVPSGKGFSVVVSGSGAVQRTTSTGLAVTGALSATGAITQGANSADSGAIRLPNTGAIIWRRANNLANDMEFYQDSNNDAVLNIQAGNQFLFKIGSTTFLDASSTGLAVTGALSATDTIDVSKAVAGSFYGLNINNTQANANGLFAALSLQSGATANQWEIYAQQNSATATDSTLAIGLSSVIGNILSLTAAGDVYTYGNHYVGGNLTVTGGYIEGNEQTAPAAPAANGYRIYAEDNGSGKTRLMVKFATGAAQQLALEP
jgi:hypothetical protein